MQVACLCSKAAAAAAAATTTTTTTTTTAAATKGEQVATGHADSVTERHPGQLTEGSSSTAALSGERARQERMAPQQHPWAVARACRPEDRGGG
jgi:hypothetical protein